MVAELRFRADLVNGCDDARPSCRRPRRGTRILLGAGIELHLGSNPVNTWHHRKRLKIISERSEALVTAVMFVRFLELRWFSCSDGSLAERTPDNVA